MKPDEVAEVERLVNGWVQDATPAVTKTMDLTVRMEFCVCLCAIYHTSWFL